MLGALGTGSRECFAIDWLLVSVTLSMKIASPKSNGARMESSVDESPRIVSVNAAVVFCMILYLSEKRFDWMFVGDDDSVRPPHGS